MTKPSFPSTCLLASLLSLLLLIMAHAHAAASMGHRPYAKAHRELGARLVKKHNRPPFKPGPWKRARATFYEGGPGTFGRACGYSDVEKEGYGLQTAALSMALFNNGQKCGACFELKCMDNPDCKPGQPSLVVTGTNHCPPNYNAANDNGGWCNPPLEHFDIAKPVFANLADYKAGVIPITYRRVPCQKQGGIRFTITGNPYFNEVMVWNVGGAGDITAVQVKGHRKLKWTAMSRLWGQKWTTNAMMVGESLTFRVRASDGRFSTAWHVAPANWQFGQTFEGKNFK
ncbi:expansin-A9-like [Cucurbita moschata]|uniref:Expansin n=1 Tax=Cucurbita moschata TaxID=3662 RepID=A0A6J1ED76_CUCMO|nr:expansin-A9-like [Cucurbita moschata]